MLRIAFAKWTDSTGVDLFCVLVGVRLCLWLRGHYMVSGLDIFSTVPAARALSLLLLLNAQRGRGRGALQRMSGAITPDALSLIPDLVLDPVHPVGIVTAIAQRIDSIGILTVIGIMEDAVIRDRGVIRALVPLTPTVIIDTTHLNMTIAHTAAAAPARDLSVDTAGSHTVVAGAVIGEALVEALIMKLEGLYVPWRKIARITVESTKTLYGSARRGVRSMRSCGRKM